MATEDRQNKIAKQIREIAGMFYTQNNPVGSMVTVTYVEMSTDLSHADIVVSLMPEPKDNEEVMEKMRKVLPALRREIGNKLELRKVPEPRLIFDDSNQRRRLVDEILGNEED